MAVTPDNEVLAGGGTTASAALRQLLEARRSVRAFNDRPVAAELLERVLAAALEAPSWGNVQPYRVAVAEGELRDALSAELSARFRAALELQAARGPRRWLKAAFSKGLPKGDYPTRFQYPDELKRRYAETGKGLYRLLGIRREDRKARDDQMAKNFEFFGAPTVLFVFCADALGPFGPLDTGIFLQSLMLAAQAEGLGSCAMGALATWSEPVRARFEIPAGYRLVCGVAIGYPAADPVNAFKPARRTVSDLLLPRRGDRG